MARTFVMSDNLSVRIELITDPEDALVRAFCVGHGSEISEGGYDTLDDAEQDAWRHADSCTRCADPDCRNTTRHDSGHRCRKN